VAGGPGRPRGGAVGELRDARGIHGAAHAYAAEHPRLATGARSHRRIPEIWRDCRARFGEPAGGEFLFGDFCIADAMYAPVVFRFTTYGVEVGDVEQRYMDAIKAHPAVQRWVADAKAEPWTMDWDVP
jgi:glutathione S-transferase